MTEPPVGGADAGIPASAGVKAVVASGARAVDDKANACAGNTADLDSIGVEGGAVAIDAVGIPDVDDAAIVVSGWGCGDCVGGEGDATSEGRSCCICC